MSYFISHKSIENSRKLLNKARNSPVERYKMDSLPPELLCKVLRETDIDVLLPLLKNDNVPDLFKECFEVVTTHNEDLKFWSPAFKRRDFDTFQPIKNKQYLTEFSLIPYDYDDGWDPWDPLDWLSVWYDTQLEPSDEMKPVLEKLYGLNGFIYWYGKDVMSQYVLARLLVSERLLVVGTEAALDVSLSGCEVKYDRLRYISIQAIELHHVIPEGELNQTISSLRIEHGKGDITNSIGPTTYKSLKRLELSIAALSESRLYRRSKPSVSEFPHCFRIKNIDFSMLEQCRLSSVSQMEKLKFPNLEDLVIFLTNNGEGVYLKDIKAPKLRKFLIATDCDFEVKNVVIGETLKELSLENSSPQDIEIKGLDDWCVTAHTLKLRETATPFRSKSFIQGFHKVEINFKRLDTRALNSIEIEHPNIKQLESTCFDGCSTFPVIKAPSLEVLLIRTFHDVDLPLLSLSYPNLTELECFMRSDPPKQLHGLHKLQKLKSLKISTDNIDVERMELDSPAWDLPNLESFDFEFLPSRATTDDLTIDMSAPKLKSLTLQSGRTGYTREKLFNSLTLKNLPNLKELVITGFRKLIVAENTGSTIETIKSEDLSRIQAENLSSIQHIAYLKGISDPDPIEDVGNISETVERTFSGIH